MHKLTKAVIVGVFTLGAATSFAYAHDGHCGHDGKADRAARHAQHQTELHDQLKLTAEQEQAWTVFTEKMKPETKPVKPDWEEIAKLPTPARMQKMLTMMQAREQAMARRIAVVQDFYAKLTPEQQKVFDAQSHGRHHHRHGHRGHHDRG